GVLGTGQDLDERAFVEVAEHADHRQATDKFRNQPKLNQILRLHGGKQLDIALGGRCGGLGFIFSVSGEEAHGLLAHAAADNFLQADKSSAAYKQNVGGIDRRELLVGMLATALGRDIGDGA